MGSQPVLGANSRSSVINLYPNLPDGFPVLYIMLYQTRTIQGPGLTPTSSCVTPTVSSRQSLGTVVISTPRGPWITSYPAEDTVIQTESIIQPRTSSIRAKYKSYRPSIGK